MEFLNFYLWLLTILVLGFALIFNICGCGFALLNSFRSPSQPIFSVFGLYIWNGCALACEFLVLLLWGLAFEIHLRKNASISDTLSGILKLSYLNQLSPLRAKHHSLKH